MSDTPATDCLRDQAQMYREQKEAAEQASRMEQERLKRCRDAVAALGQSVYAMRCALDPFGPALKATERKAHCRKVTSLLAAALTALREADLLSRLEQLDEPATLAHYRKQHDDPRATRLCFACAKQIIEADPTERPRLAQLVQDAVEEASLRGAWDWLSILLYGLTGQQRLVWKQEPSELTAPNPSSPTRESAGSGKSGRPVPVAQGERAGAVNDAADIGGAGTDREEITSRQVLILETMLAKEITSERRRKSRAAIERLVNRTYKPQTCNRDFAQLTTRGYLQSREGQGGGMWLTPKGKAEAQR